MGSFLSLQSQLLPPASSPAAAPAAADDSASPQWMLLAPYGGGSKEACNITGDPNTIAAAVTSTGHRIIVSLRLEPSPAMSRICLVFRPGTAKEPSAYSTVIAAHGGSVLLHIASTETYLKPFASDYFVYNNVMTAAGGGDPARPPALYLLPRYDGSGEDKWWRLGTSATGFLSHGEAEEFVVAQLRTLWEKGDAAAPNKAAELLLFRHGEWRAKRRLRIIHGHGRDDDGDRLLAKWEPSAVVHLGGDDGRTMLCWVDGDRGVVFSNVLDDSPELRYVPYPAEALKRRRFVCADGGAVKLVTVSPRRCSHCGCSEHATDTSTWTLKTDDMAWVLETETNTVVDSTELWALPEMPGYARVHLVYPVKNASMNGGGHVLASMSGGGDDVVSGEAVAVASIVEDEEEDEHMSLSVVISTPSSTACLGDGMQSGNGATSAIAVAGDHHHQGDNGVATVGRWPKRHRRANSMVTGPEWIA